MTEPARSAKALPAEAAAGPLRPTEGLRLLGEYQGSGFTEPRFLVRRARRPGDPAVPAAVPGDGRHRRGRRCGRRVGRQPGRRAGRRRLRA